MFQRHILPAIQSALKGFPSVLMIGARQVGKSTILDQLKAQGLIKQIITFDDLSVLEALNHDPYAFVKNLPRPVALDEIQRFPAIALVLKKIMDEEKQKGQFVLTGSANLFSLPDFRDSLAGRMAIFTIDGLSEAEIQGNTPVDLENLTPHPYDVAQIYEAIFYGSYPDVRIASTPENKDLWIKSYEMAYIERDIRDLNRNIDIVEFGRVFHLMALQSANLLNYQTLSTQVGLDHRTIKRYIEMLSITFQISLLQPFYSNLTKRMVKTPKIYMHDSGHASFVQGIHTVEGLRKSNVGHLFETWVYGELRKITQHAHGYHIYFYRTQDGTEVDFILQKGAYIMGIECKAKMTVTAKDFQGLEHFIELYPQAIGILLYLGDKVIDWGNGIKAMPVSALFGA